MPCSLSNTVRKVHTYIRMYVICKCTGMHWVVYQGHMEMAQIYHTTQGISALTLGGQCPPICSL